MVLTLRALNWSISEDLNAPPARWFCEFVESGSTGYLPGESISRSGHDRVRIDVTVDGRTERLMDGIAREWGFDEDPRGHISTASGIDLKGELLDFYPSSPVEYKGMEVLSDSTAPIPVGARKTLRLGSNSVGEDVIAAYYHTFQTVAADIAQRAGLTADFDCYDYDLGQGITWTPEDSANDILVQLASPFNATERFKIDIVIENNVVRFIERGRTAPPVVTLPYDKLLTRRVRRSGFPPFNDVQVRGVTYRFIEPDSADQVFIVEGLARNQPYTMFYRVVDKEAAQNQDIDSHEVSELQDIVVAETNGTKFYDAEGRLTRHIAIKNWSLYILRNPANGNWISTEPKVRREDTIDTWQFDGPHGEQTRHVRTVFVEDHTTYKAVDDTGAVTTRGTSNFAQFIERDEELTEYDSDGNPIYELTKTYRATPPEPDAAQTPTGLVLEREVEIIYHWSKGQRLRDTITRHYDRNNQAFPSSTSRVSDVATFKGKPGDSVYWKETPNGIVGLWEAGQTFTTPPVVLGGPNVVGAHRLGIGQIASGPDNAQISYDFPTLGAPADCEYFRGKIKTERNSKRYEAFFSMLPDLNVRTRQDLAISAAPSRWEKSQFFVVSRNARHNKDALLETIVGLAWVD